MLDYTRETAKSNLLLAQYGIKRYHSRMLRPMMTAVCHLRLSSAYKCWKEMRICGYSIHTLLYYIIRYPRDLMKLIIRKAQAGEIVKLKIGN